MLVPAQDVVPADRMAAVAHLPGIEKLLRCMLVRDPARRATLADVSRRVQHLLESAPRSQHIPEASLPAPIAPSRSDSSGMVRPLGAAHAAVSSAMPHEAARGFVDITPARCFCFPNMLPCEQWHFLLLCREF